MGRPPSDKPKIHETRIRMSDDDLEKLDYCYKVLNFTKAEIIRRGINEMHKKAVIEHENHQKALEKHKEK